jgi:hypothetical protein
MNLLSRVLVSSFFATALVPMANADLYQSDKVSFFKDAKTAGCGVQSDFDLDGSTIRVEVIMKREPKAFSVFARAYRPTSTLELRDIWLRTANLFTLERFHPAKENSNGILELRGDVDLEDGRQFLDDLEKGELEVSLIFDGPGGRLPVGIASLPASIVNELTQCFP